MKPQARSQLLLLLPLFISLACTSSQHQQVPPVHDLHNDTNPPTAAHDATGTLGSLQRLDPALDSLLAPNAKLEILVDGVDWAEGPVWRNGGLLFSDVKQNTIYRWTAAAGVHPYLQPSGYLSQPPRGGEPGSNGLTVDHKGRLVMCQHGERRVARLNLDGSQSPLVSTYQGHRFNSPNDLCFDAKGNLYFTDPPYGLEKNNADPKKEIDFNGVYLLRPDGEITRLAIDLTFPNGICLSPDEKSLYVAVSDPKNPVVMKYDVQSDAFVANGKVFFDATALVSQKLPGMPDGMKVDLQGNIWLGGPGGLLVLSPAGKHLGGILTGTPTANCAWGDDGSTLYVTANHNVCRIRTLTKGKLAGMP